jgi:hypothetical protein
MGLKPRAWPAADGNWRMVIAATTFALAAFWVGDDSGLISRPPRAAGGIVVHDFYSWPGRELGLHFCGSGREIRTYERRPEL